jgi:hypothetical protein
MFDETEWEVSTSNASMTASPDNDVDSMPRGILLDGGTPPATPLPAETLRAGGFASLPYDSFAY